jgi:hypothetical protein
MNSSVLRIARAVWPFFAAVCFLAARAPTESRAQPAPLRGKSVILSWHDERTHKDIATGEIATSTQASEIRLYISTAGRIFSELDRKGGRGGSDTKLGISDADKQFLNWKFEGASLVADQSFLEGARRVIIDFDSRYANCSVKVLHGKAAGSSNIKYRNFSRPSQIFEILSIKVTSTSCALQDGNVFGTEN